MKNSINLSVSNLWVSDGPLNIIFILTSWCVWYMYVLVLYVCNITQLIITGVLFWLVENVIHVHCLKCPQFIVDHVSYDEIMFLCVYYLAILTFLVHNQNYFSLRIMKFMSTIIFFYFLLRSPFQAHTLFCICVILCFQPQRHIGEVSPAVWAMWIKCLAQEHNPSPRPRLKPRTLNSRLEGSTYWANGPHVTYYDSPLWNQR